MRSSHRYFSLRTLWQYWWIFCKIVIILPYKTSANRMHISTHVLKLVVIYIRYLVRYNINNYSRVYPETSSFSLCILSWSIDAWTCCFPYMHLISRLLSQASYISIIPCLSWHARMGSMSLKPNHCIMITQTVTLWFTPVPFEDVSHFYMYVFRTYSTWTKGTLTVHLSQGNDHTGRIMDMVITIYWHQVMTGLVVLSVQTAWVCSRKIVACRLFFYINTEMTRHFLVDHGPEDLIHWRHTEHRGVSNQWHHDCLLNRLFKVDQRKHESSASLAFVRGFHRWPVNSSHKGPVTRKIFPFDGVVMIYVYEFV